MPAVNLSGLCSSGRYLFSIFPPMMATMTKSPTGLSWDVEPGTKCVHCLLLACRGRSRLLFRWARLLENWSPESCCQPTASQPSTASRPCWQCWLVILPALAFYFCASVRSALVISATLWGFFVGKTRALGHGSTERRNRSNDGQHLAFRDLSMDRPAAAAPLQMHHGNKALAKRCN